MSSDTVSGASIRDAADSGATITTVEPGSLAEGLGIRAGDVLLAINGHTPRDVLDVQFYAAEEELELLIRRGNRELYFRAQRDYQLPLGLDFGSVTFDGLRRCSNQCDFCFVSQMAPGLRRSLYVRDDDYRYSLLYGSFITLTGLTEEDWDRFEEQRLSPLYVSVHATELPLRRKLLGREDAPDVLAQIDRLAALGIQVHTQIVLIPGINDGLHLIRSIRDLAERCPAVQSIGIVPVGLTRYHRRQCRTYTPREAGAIVELVAPFQEAFRARYGVSLAYLADEWYLLAGLDVPPDEAYDDYPQIENGIGLVRQFLEDSRTIEAARCRAPCSWYTLACGTLIAPLMRQVAARITAACGCRIDVVPVTNRLFGETVTVSGLLGGRDVLLALTGRELGQVVVLPRAMFATPATDPGQLPPRREPEPSDGVGATSQARDVDDTPRTLDDVTVHDLVQQLERPVILAECMSELCGDTGPTPDLEGQEVWGSSSDDQ